MSDGGVTRHEEGKQRGSGEEQEAGRRRGGERSNGHEIRSGCIILAGRPSQHAPGSVGSFQSVCHMTASSCCSVKPARPVHQQPEAAADRSSGSTFIPRPDEANPHPAFLSVTVTISCRQFESFFFSVGNKNCQKFLLRRTQLLVSFMIQKF